jgi:hypothetical protein
MTCPAEVNSRATGGYCANEKGISVGLGAGAIPTITGSAA